MKSNRYSATNRYKVTFCSGGQSTQPLQTATHTYRCVACSGVVSRPLRGKSLQTATDVRTVRVSNGWAGHGTSYQYPPAWQQCLPEDAMRSQVTPTVVTPGPTYCHHRPRACTGLFGGHSGIYRRQEGGGP